MRSTTHAVRHIAVGGFAVLLAASACKGKDAAEEAETSKPVVAASTAKARIEPFTHTVSAIGTVVTRPDKFAALSAPSPTRIAKVYVSAGQRVAAGAPLVEFEQVGFNAAASASEAALTAAQRNYERAKRLADEGILPRKDAETALADLGKARTDAVNAQDHHVSRQQVAHTHAEPRRRVPRDGAEPRAASAGRQGRVNVGVEKTTVANDDFDVLWLRHGRVLDVLLTRGDYCASRDERRAGNAANDSGLHDCSRQRPTDEAFK